MINKVSRPFLGFLQATGLVVYIILISISMGYISQYFKDGSAEMVAPIIMLLLFVMSAVISSLLVLGKAGVLFWDKKYHEAFTLVAWTVGWGLMYLVLILIILSTVYRL